MEVVSYVFSILSICFYSVVYFPQLKLIYNRQSSDGLSYNMILLWTFGDALALVASQLLFLTLQTLIICWYHIFIGYITILFVFYYHKERTWRKGVGIFIFILLTLGTNICLAICLPYEKMEMEKLSQIGYILCWITSGFYIIGRLPQFYKNYVNKSIRGLSYWMYIFTILGNLCFLLSILVYSLETVYISDNLPWITVTSITISLDLLLLAQYYYYYKKNRSLGMSIDELLPIVV